MDAIFTSGTIYNVNIQGHTTFKKTQILNDILFKVFL